jgi:hypothetical protein
MLTAEYPRARQMKLNGNTLELTKEGTIPALEPVNVEKGTLSLPPLSVTYLVV